MRAVISSGIDIINLRVLSADCLLKTRRNKGIFNYFFKAQFAVPTPNPDKIKQPFHSGISPSLSLTHKGKRKPLDPHPLPSWPLYQKKLPLRYGSITSKRPFAGTPKNTHQNKTEPSDKTSGETKRKQPLKLLLNYPLHLLRLL